MRRTTIGIVAASAVALCGCGSTGKFANNPRPATPVNVTVYVNDARVSISPATVGAGPVIFIVTNQASNSESLSITPAGDQSQSLADTGPISPQATAQVTVNFSQGYYTVSADRNGNTDAAIATPSNIQAATLNVGPPRPSSSGSLLQP